MDSSPGGKPSGGVEELPKPATGSGQEEAKNQGDGSSSTRVAAESESEVKGSEHDAVLKSGDGGEAGLTCLGLDTGIQIEDFIKDDNETEEGKADKQQQQQEQQEQQEPQAQEEQQPEVKESVENLPAAAGNVGELKADEQQQQAEKSTPAVATQVSEQSRAERLAAVATETVQKLVAAMVQEKSTGQEQVVSKPEKVEKAAQDVVAGLGKDNEGGEGKQEGNVLERVQHVQQQQQQQQQHLQTLTGIQVITTEGENEETIDGAALRSVQAMVAVVIEQDKAAEQQRQQERTTVTAAAATATVTAAGENDIVVVSDAANAREEATVSTSAASKKAPKSCVVNMASNDDQNKDKDQDAEKTGAGLKKKDGPTGSTGSGGAATAAAAKTNGSAAKSGKKNSTQQNSLEQIVAESKKRGRKPGSGNKKSGPATAGTAEKGVGSGKSRVPAASEPKHLQVTFDLTTQPFTDAQQVQLRAQILVYGAIIQGALPDETLMAAAFVDVSKVHSLESFDSHFNSSRSTWEKIWKAASDRLQRTGAKMSSPPALRPPSPKLSLPKSPSKSNRRSPTATTGGAAPAASELPSVSPLANSVMSMASATVSSWNSARARSPTDPWQIRSRFPFSQQLSVSSPALVPSWGIVPPAPQQQFPSPLGGAWGLFSSQPAFTNSGGQLVFQGASPSPPPLTAAATSPPLVVVDTAASDVEKSKKRRRKDSEATEEVAAVIIPSDVSPATAGLLEDRSNDEEDGAGAGDDLHINLMSPEELEKLSGSEELVKRLESAKTKAEEAASAAASILQRSQQVWDEVKEKRRSNNLSSKEAQLASSFAAVTAAVSVAKAAAAAANVAYAAALQARAMAKDVVLSSSTNKDSAETVTVTAAGVANDVDPTVTHVNQGDEAGVTAAAAADKSAPKSSSVKSAVSDAKSVIKEQVCAASAAVRRAENLDAVVRAAELAAEAACQAGQVMVIGDPESLTQTTAEVPPKSGKVSGKRNARSKARKKETTHSAEEHSVEGGETEKETTTRKDDAEGDGDGNEQGKDTTPPTETARTSGGDVVDGEAEPSEGMVEDKQQCRPDEIVVGSHVEIVPEEEGLQGVWFSAKVISMNGDEALVVYDELLDEDGNGKLKEWVDITSQIDNVPRVRIAHPMTKDGGGMRKRRRAAMGNQRWVKDDHVDVWVRDGWWEGIVQSVDEDENLVTVYFPGDGDTEVAKSWNLRPSLVWQDDAWIPWRDTQGHNKKQKVEDGISTLTSVEIQKATQESCDTPTGKRKRSEGTPLDTPKGSRSGVKPTIKRRKFSDVLEKDEEARDARKPASQSSDKKKLRSSDSTAKSSSASKPKEKDKKQSNTPKTSKNTSPSSAKKRNNTNDKQVKKKSTGSDVTSDASKDGEVRKSGRMIHPTSKLLEGLETTPKAGNKKNGAAT